MAVKAGPWGGNGGYVWDIGTVSSSARLIKIIIRHAGAIDSITFCYFDNGNYHWTPMRGGSGGDESKINLEPCEYLTSMSGHYGMFGGFHVVKSLTFNSNIRRHGPYGSQVGTPFSLPLANGKIVGFHGRAGLYLDAIGVYIA